MTILTGLLKTIAHWWREPETESQLVGGPFDSICIVQLKQPKFGETMEIDTEYATHVYSYSAGRWLHVGATKLWKDLEAERCAGK